MVQSPEFSQYEWLPPRSWSQGRTAGNPRVIVIHTTQGSEGPTSAENGALYDQRRTDGTSAHFYVDSDSVVQCVKTTDRAHTALWNGNNIGIHIEVCGRAEQTDAQWADAVSSATIEQLAQLCVVLLKKYKFPIVDLTPDQVRNGSKGFCTHQDITKAFPQDGGTHWDPGPRFPFGKLFARIQELQRREGGGELPTVKEIWYGPAADVIDNWDPNGAKTNPHVQAGYALQKAAQWSGEAKTIAANVQKQIDSLKAEQAEVRKQLAEVLDAVNKLATPPPE